MKGDRLLAQGSNKYTWSSAQNVQLTLIYPQNENGNRNETISFVQTLIQQVSCNLLNKEKIETKSCYFIYLKFQSSSTGRGSITSGGIGQNRISIFIEANQTLYLNYTTFIFGK